MALSVEYHIECDGEYEGELCLADFYHYTFNISDLNGLERQAEQRGWRFDDTGKHYCPLHKGTE